MRGHSQICEYKSPNLCCFCFFDFLPLLSSFIWWKTNPSFRSRRRRHPPPCHGRCKPKVKPERSCGQRTGAHRNPEKSCVVGYVSRRDTHCWLLTASRTGTETRNSGFQLQALLNNALRRGKGWGKCCSTDLDS